jgi:hypothetical protein
VAEVTDGIGTDIDLHLLQNPTVTNGFATGCLGRAHEKLEVTGLGPGTYWLIADSWSNGSTEYVGEYTVAFEWVADEVWREVEVDEGVQWRTLRTLNLGGGDQTINVLEVDPSWDLQPHSHNGCKTVAGQLDGLGAIAGINGGFFNSSCQPLDLLKADGNLVSTNQMTTFTQPTMGWNAGQPPSIVWIDPGADWSNVSNAMGGYPRLVDNGVASAEVKPGESVYSAVDWQKHPRTAVGLTESGTVLMVTIDGRTAAGDGITTPDLAGFMKDLGAVDAMCLDGGGSTTMVVKDCWIGDVVSFPSDNSQADHAGARPVASGLYIR